MTRTTYDAISHLLTTSTTLRYDYDVAGNLTDNNGTARTFNKLSQISSSGFAYDANGNLLNDGTNAYVWDRANRLLLMDR